MVSIIIHHIRQTTLVVDGRDHDLRKQYRWLAVLSCWLTYAHEDDGGIHNRARERFHILGMGPMFWLGHQDIYILDSYP
jgi:hypothetical protein